MKKLLLALLLLFTAFNVEAAITFKEDQNGACDDCDSVTINATVTTCDNQIMVAGAGIEETGDSDNQPNDITWNGTSLTKVGCDNYWNGEDACIYYLLNPDDGTYDFVTTYDASSSVDIVTGFVIMCGAEQQAPEANCNGEDSCSITTVTDNAGLVTFISTVQNTSHSVTGDTDTEEWEKSPPAFGMDGALGTTTDAGTAGSKTCGWTNGITGNRSGSYCVAFEAASGGGGGGGRRIW
jgi:hypothetical protein